MFGARDSHLGNHEKAQPNSINIAILSIFSTNILVPTPLKAS